MCHKPIKFMLRSKVLLRNRPNQHFIVETILYEFLLSYNCLIFYINQLVIILIGHFRMREIIGCGQLSLHLYKHCLRVKIDNGIFMQRKEDLYPLSFFHLYFTSLLIQTMDNEGCYETKLVVNKQYFLHYLLTSRRKSKIQLNTG